MNFLFGLKCQCLKHFREFSNLHDFFCTELLTSVRVPLMNSNKYIRVWKLFINSFFKGSLNFIYCLHGCNSRRLSQKELRPLRKNNLIWFWFHILPQISAGLRRIKHSNDLEIELEMRQQIPKKIIETFWDHVHSLIAI